MTSKQPLPPATAASSGSGTVAAATTTNPNDPAALLLNILRSVDREVRSNLELDQDGLAVVERFRAIDRALAVRPVAQRKDSLASEPPRVAVAYAAPATR